MEIERIFARTMRNAAVALLASALFLFQGHSVPLVTGFMAGTAAGMWNAYFLVQRCHRVVGLPVKKGKAVMYGGIIMRLSLIFGVLYLAYRLPRYLNLPAAAAGLMVVPVIALSIGVGSVLRERLTGRNPE
ncbi:MAG: ATP synthase subunit I [Peptococcaceae bacterium]|nr:ATP synthase subunit I [Peptococcaceae bacterium]